MYDIPTMDYSIEEILKSNPKDAYAIDRIMLDINVLYGYRISAAYDNLYIKLFGNNDKNTIDTIFLTKTIEKLLSHMDVSDDVIITLGKHIYNDIMSCDINGMYIKQYTQHIKSLRHALEHEINRYLINYHAAESFTNIDDALSYGKIYTLENVTVKIDNSVAYMYLILKVYTRRIKIGQPYKHELDTIKSFIQ